MNANEFLDVGFSFHGHKCPAMPLGLKAAVIAMNQLGVERAKDKELQVIAETGKGHAAGCFLDGVMTATGCTYGKSNIEKLYYNKMAFTLIDVAKQKSGRVSLKPEFLTNMLQSPFVQARKKGIPPQDIPAEVSAPLIEKVLGLPKEAFLDIGPVESIQFTREKGVFDIAPCAKCGEMTFVDKLLETSEGKVCLGCKDQK